MRAYSSNNAKSSIKKLVINYVGLLMSAILLVLSVQARATNTNDWDTSTLGNAQANNLKTIDHSIWQKNLDAYLESNHTSGINLYKYKAVTQEDHLQLKAYLKALSQIDPKSYNKAEQMAFWINLYNALTVDLILTNYPVKSITKLGDSFFAFGPWDDKAITINHQELTLNDIEHKILRPIWKDPRIHYAVNCASLSCPNLSATAYTSANLEQLLEEGARTYVNHSRGVDWDGEDLKLSKIYSWYKEDFGDSEHTLIQHLTQYAKPELKAKLLNFQQTPEDIDYHYDWQLNELK